MHKNLFVLKTGLKAKIMLVRGKGQPTYLLSSNPQSDSGIVIIGVIRKITIKGSYGSGENVR